MTEATLKRTRELEAILLAHETAYVPQPQGGYFWSCSCGANYQEIIGWDECHKMTRAHWASKLLVVFDAWAQEAREKVAAWMIEHSFTTGHGDTLDDLLKELSW